MDRARARARRLRAIGREAIGHWNLVDIERLDHVGGQALWRVWGCRMPPDIELSDTQREIFERVALLDAEREEPEASDRIDPVTRLGQLMFAFFDHLYGGLSMFGAFVLDLAGLVRRPKRIPWTEISANIYSAGAQALAITTQIGVMRVTEELDAMQVMSIPHGLRLVLPRVIALGVAMPMLVMWTNVITLTGGALAAKLVLSIDVSFFLRSLPSVVPIANLWIGLGKGIVFGMLIALTACHFGFRIKANSQSLGEGTTTSVVTSITVVILADAVFAILFQNVGL